MSAIRIIASRVLWLGVALLAISATTNAADPQPSGKRLGLGGALEAALSPTSNVSRFPEYVPPGGKGITQRSFLTLEKATRNIQLAFVLDATLTMSKDIKDLQAKLDTVVSRIKQQVTDVKTADDVMVEVAVIIYRDIWTKYDEGKDQVTLRRSPVEAFPERGFVDFSRDDDRQELVKWLASIETQDGAPGFEEQVDRGIDAALNLHWSARTDVTRIIFVAGDAPPWSEDYLAWGKNPDWLIERDDVDRNLPLRGFSTASLSQRLKKQRIALYAVCCESTETAPSVASKVASMRQFFRELADSSEGDVLDLKHEDTVARLTRLSSVENRELIELRDFKPSEIQLVANNTPTQPVRMAFVPWVTWQELNFADRFTNDAYRIPSLMTKTVRELHADYSPTIDEVRRECQDLLTETRQDEFTTVIPRIAKSLGVDLIIAGAITSKSDAGVSGELSVFRSDGSLLAKNNLPTTPLSEIPKAVWTLLSESMKSKSQGGDSLARRFASTAGAQPPARAFESAKLSSGGLRLLQNAYESLEEAAEFPLGEAKGVALSRQALEFLQQLVATESPTVEVMILLGSAHTNLGNSIKAQEAVVEAKRLASELPANSVIRLEAEADSALYVDHDPVMAIEKYKAIAIGEGSAASATKLRAQWMLVGLYLGDWGIRDVLYEKLPKVKCCDEARAGIFTLLRTWPHSPEAGFYRRFIQPPLPSPKAPSDPAGAPVIVADTERSLLVPARRPTVMTAARLRRPPPETTGGD